MVLYESKSKMRIFLFPIIKVKGEIVTFWKQCNALKITYLNVEDLAVLTPIIVLIF